MFEEMTGQVAARFARVESRRRACDMLRGLLAGLPRKNCWTIAEHAGDASPYGMQYLLARAAWDAGAVRDDLRGYVADQLGGEQAVLVVDETGDLKKGTATAGVQRQYSGTAGRVENSQVAVFLACATAAGHAFIDRELYLPRSWICGPARCAAAGIPEQTAFATKPQLARRMISRALDAGLAAWVAAGEVYGSDPGLRAELEKRQAGYVLAVACSHRVTTGAGTCRADALAASLPRHVWQRHSAGQGAKGHRFYDWAWASIEPGRPGCHWLLIRRHRRTGELAFYRCHTPQPVPLQTLVTVAGRRWAAGEAFQAGKGLCGLDQHQVRTWRSWYRWTTLAMLAHAFLAAVAAAENARQPASEDLIPLTLAEVQRLMTRLTSTGPLAPGHCHRWSHWRRRHQARARACHYQRQPDQRR